MPQVILESINVFGVDSVILTGKVTSIGSSNIEHAGFEFSTNSSFSGTPTTVLLNGALTTFSAVVHANNNSVYYFKAIAINGQGEGSSGVLKYTVQMPAPETAPCTLANNYVIDNPSSYSITAYANSSNPTWGNYEVDFYGPNEDVYIYFHGMPSNGIYATVGDASNINSGQVAMTISGFTPGIINGGQKVYVGIDSIGKTTISFCSLVYTISGVGSTTISGKGTY